MSYEIGKIYEMKLEDLVENPDQPRKHFDDDELAALKDSIVQHGLLQPILVKESDEGRVIIVSGERRFRACKEIEGKDSISVWFTDGDPQELALIENLIRDDLSPMETSNAIKKLENKYDDQGVLAKALGKSQSVVSEILSLQKLPTDFKRTIEGRKEFALRRLKRIAACKKEDERQRLCDEYLAQVEAKKNAAKRVRTKGKDLATKKLEGMSEQIKLIIDKNDALKLNDIQLQKLRSIKDSINDLVKEINGM